MASSENARGSCLAALGLMGALLSLAAAPTSAAERDWDPLPARNPPKNRYVVYHEQVAKGPHAKLVGTVTLGAKGRQEFIAGAELADGTLALFGNVWGAGFTEGPPPVILGAGQGQARGDEPAGFLAFYAPELAGLRRIVKFDQNILRVTCGTTTADGQGLLLACQTQAGFAALEKLSGVWQGEGDACILRLTADGQKIDWARRLRGKPADTLWQDKTGQVYCDVGGLQRISADGKDSKTISTKTRTGTAKWLHVDPDGNAYFGGDRNTRTGREPWRQPYLYKFDPQGKQLWAAWEFSPRVVSSAHAGLESDSSVRGMAQRPDGTLIVTGWSDGGNSVFQRQAMDWKRNCPEAPLGWSPWWPRGANSYAHLMLFDPQKQETVAHLWWCGYLPNNFMGGPVYANRTAGQGIGRVISLPGGAIGFTGGGATGLIQTPNAFWKDPHDGKKMGGETCVILNQDLSGVLFSSYLPNVSGARPAPTRKGMLVTGRIKAQDGGTSAYAFALQLP